MKIKGHGGFWVVPALSPLATEDVIVHNAEYELDVEADTHETRSAGCEGWTEQLPVIRRVNAASMRVFEDDLAYPQALGFTEGSEVTFWLKRGATSGFDKLVDAIVKKVLVVNHQQRARTVQITCEGGKLIRDAAPPRLPAPDPEPEDPEVP